MKNSGGVRLDRVIGGRYRLTELIGLGGYGGVYKAVDLETGSDVAIKLYHEKAFDAAEVMGRWEREVRILDELASPSVVRCFGHGVTDRDEMYLVMELLVGRTWEQYLGVMRSVDEAEVVRVALQVLAVLGYAHQRNIVHRDIKPGNLYRCEFGGRAHQTKVLDFGLAKELMQAGNFVTHSRALPCSPHYVAPERVRLNVCTPGTDLYSLGITLLELLAGEPPFAGNNMITIVARQASPEPVPLPAVVRSSRLAWVIARAVEKDPALRYQTAEEMAADVRIVEAELAGRVDPTGESSANRWSNAQTLRIEAVDSTSPRPDSGSTQLLAGGSIADELRRTPKPRPYVPPPPDAPGSVYVDDAVLHEAPVSPPRADPVAARPAAILDADLAVLQAQAAARTRRRVPARGRADATSESAPVTPARRRIPAAVWLGAAALILIIAWLLLRDAG